MSDIMLEVESGTAQITLNRPKFRNAINRDVIDGLGQIISEVESRTDLGAVLVTGSGQDSFCSGGDLKWLSELKEPADGALMAKEMQVLLTRLSALSIPVVAVLNGYALGGGAELALACDFRVFERHTFMSFKQTQVGLTTGWTGGWRLVDLIGYSRALELALTGQKVGALQAHALGLCNIIADSNCGIDAAQEMLSLIARGAPAATAATKRVFQAARQTDLRTNMVLENDVFRSLWGAPAHVEALHAFREKRRPKFRS